MSYRHQRRSRSRIVERPSQLSRRRRNYSKSKSRSISRRRKSPVRRRQNRSRARKSPSCTGGRIRNPNTGRCVKAEDFTPVELVQFLRLLGLAPTADHAENARILRSAIKPDRFDEAVQTLSGYKRSPLYDLYEHRKPKNIITAAERVGLPRPSHLPPVPPTPPFLFSPLSQSASTSPQWLKNPITDTWMKNNTFNMYSPGKVDLDIYEDDEDYDDYDDDEYNDYDEYDSLGYPKQDWRQKLSYLFASPSQQSPSFSQVLPSPSPTAVQAQQQNLASLFGFQN